MFLDGPAIGTARSLVAQLDLLVNGVPSAIAALAGQCYAFAQADALGAREDFAADANPVTCFARATSSGWLGTSIAVGFVSAPPPPPIIAPVITPAAAATGGGTASALAGRGATFLTASSAQFTMLARVGALALDPAGRATASAGFRAYARFSDGSERDFWRASVSLAPGATGNPSLTVSDPRNLIDASGFTAFTLPDGSAGARLAAAGGIDLLIPLDAAVLTAGPPGPVEVRFEARTDASAATDRIDLHGRKRLTDRVGKLGIALRRSRVPSEVVAWVRTAASVLQSGRDISTVGVAAHLLRQGRDAALDVARFDLSSHVNRILRDVTGVSVRLPDLLAVRVLDDVSTLTPVRFEVTGDDGWSTDNVAVAVEVNGRPADAVVFDAQPSVTDGTSQGRVAWAFGTRRPEDVACASCPSDLGLTIGQNQIVVTVSDARSNAVIGAADALVVLAPGRSPVDSPSSIEDSARPARRPGSVRRAGKTGLKRGTRRR
jgi:hypothetical protein